MLSTKIYSKPSGWLNTRDGCYLRDEAVFQGRSLVPTIQRASGMVNLSATIEDKLKRPGDVRVLKSAGPVDQYRDMGGFNYLPYGWQQDDFRRPGDDTRNQMRGRAKLGARSMDLSTWRPIGFRQRPQLILG